MVLQARGVTFWELSCCFSTTPSKRHSDSGMTLGIFLGEPLSDRITLGAHWDVEHLRQETGCAQGRQLVPS